MEVEEPGTLIPEGLDPPVSECVRFRRVRDPRYALRRGTYVEPEGRTIVLLAGTQRDNVPRMMGVLDALRFWACVVPADVMDPLLTDDAGSEPAEEPASKRGPADEFDPVRDELDAMDPELREKIDVVLWIAVEDYRSGDRDQYLLWSIDPEIYDGCGHRYGYGKEVRVSIDLDKRKHGRVRIVRPNRNDLWVGPNDRADKFPAPSGCTVWGAAIGNAKWSEYHITGCSYVAHVH